MPASGLLDSSSLKARLRHRVGGYGPLIAWYRRIRPRSLWLRRNPWGKATRRLVDAHGWTVRHGFASGVVYPPEAAGAVGALPTKLLGVYERELHNVMASFDDYDLFVDLGSGDGYFCVAYARRAPHSRVIGYELEARERRIAQQLAKINGVNIELRGRVDHDELNALPAGKLLMLVDIEGYEYELLDPAVVPRLREVTMIVESHRRRHPDIVEVLTRRFAGTHDIATVKGEPRYQSEYPELEGWPADLANYALSERGGFPLWMVMTPNVEAAGSADAGA